MPLIKNTYGKGRVRVMRVNRSSERHEVRELNVKAMVEGDFARAYVDADNSTSLCTDTVKNIINVVARDNLDATTEAFCRAAAKMFLGQYPQVDRVTVTAHETKWSRYLLQGKPHPHGFILDSNGQPFVDIVASREMEVMRSGLQGFTFLKSTASGWENFHLDAYTTLAPTSDRICSTSMNAAWRWGSEPEDYVAANAKVLETAMDVFMSTYSKSVQDSLYRMGEAVLAAVPAIAEISLACPNKHYIPINLGAFNRTNENQVFLPTDEPHGQIECTISR